MGHEGGMGYVSQTPINFIYRQTQVNTTDVVFRRIHEHSVATRSMFRLSPKHVELY